jgi:hypothetical protein
MDASRKALVAIALAGATLSACDALLGLDAYKNVACAFDCGVEAGGTLGEASPDDATFDASAAAETGDASDAGVTDAGPDVVMPPGDSAFDGPSLTEVWAHWPMPNPDAAIAPGSDADLPNPMSYDAGEGGSSPTVYDNVTHLTWWRTPLTVGDAGAQAACASLGGSGWHVPTRIELVSLIDFAVPATAATIDSTAVPPVPADVFLTSSVVAGDGGLLWVVDFSTGLTVQRKSAAVALCVEEPAQ